MRRSVGPLFAVFQVLLVILATVSVLMVNPVVGWAEKPQGMSDFRFYPSPSPANDFPMTTPQGNTLKLSDLKGQVVILNFWRENCPYCVIEKRHLKGMLKQVNQADVKVLCVNFWDSPAAVKQYGLQAGGDLLIAARPAEGPRVVQNVLKGRLMGYYVVNEEREAIYEVKGFPTSYVIDKAGAIVAEHVGMADWAQPVVRNWIAKLAGDGRTPTSAPEEYTLPDWLDRLLSGRPTVSFRSFAGVEARGASASTRSSY